MKTCDTCHHWDKRSRHCALVDFFALKEAEEFNLTLPDGSTVKLQDKPRSRGQAWFKYIGDTLGPQMLEKAHKANQHLSRPTKNCEQYTTRKQAEFKIEEPPVEELAARAWSRSS